MIIDAHVHFNLKVNSPYEGMIHRLSSNGICKCVLIINDENEFKVLQGNIDRIINDGYVGAICIIINPHDSDPLRLINKCVHLNLPIAIKIHPRKNNVTKENFLSISELIRKTKSSTIVIDSFIYGPQIDSHIGCELAIYLSNLFPKKKIVLAHAGGCEMLKVLLLTRPLKNIYYDLSLSCNYLMDTSIMYDMAHAIKYWNNRIMFGTDYPDFSFTDSLYGSNKLCDLAAVNDNERDNFFYKNASSIFDIIV